MPQDEFINQHFGLWQENRALLAECQRICWEGRKDAPANPDGVVCHPPGRRFPDQHQGSLG